jgi:hypothetical protein
MNATKLILAIAFFAFSTMVFAQSKQLDQNEPAPTLSVKISLKVALQMPGLVKAMYVQLDPRFLLVADQRIYTVKVKYRNVVYFIWGTKAEWKRFFTDHIGIDPADPAG